METSAFNATNVEKAFAEVLDQIYKIVSKREAEADSKKAVELQAAMDPRPLPSKGGTINLKKEESVAEKSECC